MGVVVLLRHGQTDWSRAGRHTGTTDVPLNAEGEQQALALAGRLSRQRFRLVLTSPLVRARRTATLAGLSAAVPEAALAEWDYGDYEGRTTEEIQAEHPGWYLWHDGVPRGETLDQVAARADQVLARIEEPAAEGDVVLVGHGHALRVLAARWIDQAATTGSRLRLDSGTWSILGWEHQRRIIDRWNNAP